MGVVAGDALGVPYEFHTREKIRSNPATTMRGYGTYNMPPGTWSDDSSMTLAELASLADSRELGKPIDFRDMMERFFLWMKKGEYTPYGEMFDIGQTTRVAIDRYEQNGKNYHGCGGSDERDNGNGSLMRILPICLYVYELQKSGAIKDEEAVLLIHTASGLTHNHIRSKIACGLYYFCVRSLLDLVGSLTERLQAGIDLGVNFYRNQLEDVRELYQYNRIRKLASLKETPEKDIRSGGYVVDTITAAMWCLILTDSYEECELKAVNLGYDTDTTAAVAGGLAGLYYRYDGIPESWRCQIARREWIEELCEHMLT